MDLGRSAPGRALVRLLDEPTGWAGHRARPVERAKGGNVRRVAIREALERGGEPGRRVVRQGGVGKPGPAVCGHGFPGAEDASGRPAFECLPPGAEGWRSEGD